MPGLGGKYDNLKSVLMKAQSQNGGPPVGWCLIGSKLNRANSRNGPTILISPFASDLHAAAG